MSRQQSRQFIVVLTVKILSLHLNAQLPGVGLTINGVFAAKLKLKV